MGPSLLGHVDMLLFLFDHFRPSMLARGQMGESLSKLGHVLVCAHRPLPGLGAS